MLVERLILRNFKRFRDAEIHFRDGINGIVGNNGTGKSSIVEAILFALFGVQGTGIQSEYIVSSFAGEKAKCEVRLDFQIQGMRYTITRTFRRGNQTVHEARLNMGEKLLASGVSEVGEEVARLCGMGPSDFKNTVYAAQKDLPALLESRPGARKEWFMQALGIESLKNRSDETIREWIDETEKAVEREKNRLAVLSGQGDITEIPVLEEELAGIEQALFRKGEERTMLERVSGLLREAASLEQSEMNLLRRLEQAESELARLSAARSRLEELSPALRRFAELSGEIASLKEKEEQYADIRDRMGRTGAAIQAGKKRLLDISEMIEVYTGETAEFISLSATPDRLAKARKDLADLDRASFIAKALSDLSLSRDRVLALLRECTEREEVLSRRLAEGTILKERLVALSAREKELERESAELALREETLAEERLRLTSDWERIRSSGREGTCPLCHQTLGDFFAHIEQEYTGRLARIGEEIVSLSRARESSQKERAENAGERALVEQELGEITRAEQELREVKAQEKSLTSRLEEIERDCASRRQELAALGIPAYSPGRHSEARREVAALEQQAERYRELRFHQESLASLTLERDRLLGEMEREVATLRSLEDAAASLGYDPAYKKSIEEELGALRILRDEALVLEERLGREPEIRRDRERLVGEREEIRARLLSCRKTMAGSGFPGADPASVSARIGELAKEVSLLNTRSGILRERLDRLRAIAADQERARAELATLERRLVLLRITRKTVSEFILYLAGVIRAEIEDEVSRILAMITSGRYDRVIMDEDFTILVRDIDGDFPVQRFSGGEQDDIAVALRIALSRCLSGIHGVRENTFLIFDEIFGSQDEERRANLLQALRSQEANFPQIILISHLPEIQGEFAHTLLVEMVDDMQSRIVEVS